MMKSSLQELRALWPWVRPGKLPAGSDLVEPTITLANGSIVSLLYDNANRLLYKGDLSPTSGIGYGCTLDLNGNRVTITVNDGSVTENVCDNQNAPHQRSLDR